MEAIQLLWRPWSTWTTTNRPNSKESSDGSEEEGKATTQNDSALEVDDDEMRLTESAVPASLSSSGMAHAIARIFLAAPKPGVVRTAVVLSKTKTPLQLQATAEAQGAKTLTALYVPNPYDDDDQKELERYHRRIATRGVVALFNAIAVHQNPKPPASQPAEPPAKPKDKDPKSKLNKETFLAMIKQRAEEAAAAQSASTTDKTLPPVSK
jgi:Rrp15p